MRRAAPFLHVEALRKRVFVAQLLCSCHFASAPRRRDAPTTTGVRSPARRREPAGRLAPPKRSIRGRTLPCNGQPEWNGRARRVMTRGVRGFAGGRLRSWLSGLAIPHDRRCRDN